MSDPPRPYVRTVTPSSKFNNATAPPAPKQKFQPSKLRAYKMMRTKFPIPSQKPTKMVKMEIKEEFETPKSEEKIFEEEKIAIANKVASLTEEQLNTIPVKEILKKTCRSACKRRPSIIADRAMEIVKQSINVPAGAQLTRQPQIPNDVKIGSALQSPEDFKEDTLKIEKTMKFHYVFGGSGGKETVKDALSKIVKDENSEERFPESEVLPPTPKKQKPQKYLARPGNHLPWPVFWKSVPEYTQDDIHLHVNNTMYTPISSITKTGGFLIPIEALVDFLFEGRRYRLSFLELLNANGISLIERPHFRVFQVLQKAGLHLRADYAARLHKIQFMSNQGKIYQPGAEPAIALTPDTPPFICLNPDAFKLAIGTRIAHAVIVDTSGDRPPLPGQSYSNTIYTETLPLKIRHQILVLFSSDVPIQQISRQLHCSLSAIHETIGTRILIEQRLILDLLDSEDELEDVENSTAKLAKIGDIMRPRNKIRRTHYVDLNKLVWKHFQECQNQGIQINGKHLKDQAMRYAREMGLDTFRGSEGWLDAFKRRHRIDLKQMTGHPVCYENDMYDEVGRECQDLSPSLLDHNGHRHNSFLPSIHSGAANGHHDEFPFNFFNTLSSFGPSAPEPPSTHLQNMINQMITPSTSGGPTSTSSSNGESLGGDGSLQHPATTNAVIRSCQIKVADKEVSHALDTIRAYILKNDAGAMSLLLQLQERLAGGRVAATGGGGGGFEIQTDPNAPVMSSSTSSS